MENVTDIQQGFNFAQLLGFLGLLGIVLLIIIYLIKPNYQQKFISSTFVWKLSLKYRRRKIPINQLKNIVIIICQILIIALCSFILAKPYVGATGAKNANEKIIIIEASANMQAVNERGVTRFDRSVENARSVAEEAIHKNGRVTVILAKKTAITVVSKADSIAMLNDYMTDLECSYSVADIQGAMDIAENILVTNPSAEVILYTETEYLAPGRVNIKKVSDFDDSFKNVWNAAILDVNVTKGVLNEETGEIDHDERYHVFEVQAASFGKDAEFNIFLQIDGISGGELSLRYSSQDLNPVFLDGEVVKIQFNRHPDWVDIEWFAKAEVWIDRTTGDSFVEDNNFSVYGRMRESVSIQYISTDASNPERIRPAHSTFVLSSLMGIKSIFADTWDINIFANDMVPADRYYISPEDGADIYIFEHYMPEYIPDDGIVILINPDVLPKNLEGGANLGGWQGRVDSMGEIVAGDEVVPAPNGLSPIINNFDSSLITISKYIEFLYEGNEYQTVLYDSDADFPLLLTRNTDFQKVAVMPFNIHNSNIAMLIEGPVLFLNLFEYFFPPTLTQYAYEVDDMVHINPRGRDLLLRNQNGQNQHPLSEEDEDIRYSEGELPIEFKASQIGSYFMNFSFLNSIEDYYHAEFFVKIARSESDFNRVVTDFQQPVRPTESTIPWDLILYFASALIALIFVERILDSVDL